MEYIAKAITTAAICGLCAFCIHKDVILGIPSIICCVIMIGIIWG